MLCMYRMVLSHLNLFTYYIHLSSYIDFVVCYSKFLSFYWLTLRYHFSFYADIIIYKLILYETITDIYNYTIIRTSLY